MKDKILDAATELNIPMNKVTIYFKFLENLRESGVTNMFGATPYLEEHFNMEKEEAKKVLQAWMGIKKNK